MVEYDNVNRPKHYCREGGMECIDEMLLIYGPRAVMCFCICNMHKYRYRAADKNGEEDLRKSDWYLRKFRELKERYPNDIPEFDPPMIDRTAEVYTELFPEQSRDEFGDIHF